MSTEGLQDLDSLFAAHGRVEELAIDEEFINHMADVRRQYAKHAVSEGEVREVHATAPRYFENAGKRRSAPIIMLGSTISGRIIAVPLKPTLHNGVWQPVTAYEANARDRQRYWRERDEREKA